MEVEVYINHVCTLEIHNGFRKICLAVAAFSVPLYTFPPPAKQSLKEAAYSVALLHTHAAALQSLYKKLSLSFISNDEMKCRVFLIHASFWSPPLATVPL